MRRHLPPFPESPAALVALLVGHLGDNALARLRLVAADEGGPSQRSLDELAAELWAGVDATLPRAEEVVACLVAELDSDGDEAVWVALSPVAGRDAAAHALIRGALAAVEALPVAWWAPGPT